MCVGNVAVWRTASHFMGTFAQARLILANWVLAKMTSLASRDFAAIFTAQVTTRVYQRVLARTQAVPPRRASTRVRS